MSNQNNEDFETFWKFAEAAYEEIATWPEWKRCELTSNKFSSQQEEEAA